MDFKPGDMVGCSLREDWKGITFEVASEPWTTSTGAEMIAIIKPPFPWNNGYPWGVEVPVAHLYHIKAKKLTL